MKSGCILRLSKEALAKALGLPEEASVSSVFMDATDHAQDSVSIVLRGVGEPTLEGCQFKYVTLDEITTRPPLDEMGVSLHGLHHEAVET